MQRSNANSPEEVIAAIASAAGSAARGIIRISGAETVRLLQSFLSVLKTPPEINLVSARQITVEYPVGKSGALLVMQILIWPTSRSYTGQPAAEIHMIGSPPLLDAVLNQLYQLGARAAQPGEFTLRSFLSGRLSLVQAEAVLGVIDADSDRDLDQALTQLAGGISPLMRQMRDQLLDDLADLEAGLDFVDEDIDFVDRTEFQNRLQKLLLELEQLCDAAENRMINRVEKRVILAGLPNAGKSTLFNWLTAGDAIVSEIEGTTTDYLIGRVNWNGTEIAFHDTAGWEENVEGKIDQTAQKLRVKEYEQADLILWCTAAKMKAEELQHDQVLFDQLLKQNLPAVRITTKSDLISQHDLTIQTGSSEVSEFALCNGMSVSSGAGLEEFRAALFSRLIDAGKDHEILGATAARCKDSLRIATSHLQNAYHLAQSASGDELIAEEIRSVLQELGLILGHVYTDDLLDRVFSKFCIGK